MQKKLIAVAVTALVSSAAMAQVSLYGVADVFVTQNKVGDDQAKMMVKSGGLSGSRIGFTGEEDLGGGMKALARVETSLVLDSPAATSLGNRQAFAGLAGGFGQVTVGRQYTPIFNALAGYLPEGHSDWEPMVAISADGNMPGAYAPREDNAIRYQTPQLGGMVTLALQRGVDENQSTVAPATAASNNKAHNTGIEAKLAMGALTGALAVHNTADNANNVADTAIKRSALSVNYDAKVVKVFLNSYANKNSVNKGSALNLGVAAPVGAGTVIGSLTSGKVDTATERKYKGYSFTYTHMLGKRTTAYASLNQVSEKVTTDVKTKNALVGLRLTF